MVHMEIWANRLACLLAKAYNFYLFLSRVWGLGFRGLGGLGFLGWLGFKSSWI